MNDSLLTKALNAVSGGTFTEPTQSVQVPQAAAMQPASFSPKESQVADASARIKAGFAANGQFPTLNGEIARLNQEQAIREQAQTTLASQLNDTWGSTGELQSGSSVERLKGNVKNDLASFAGAVARIGNQIRQAPQGIKELMLLNGTSDQERAVFNAEQQRKTAQQDGNIQRNALVADNILSGTNRNDGAIDTVNKNVEAIRQTSDQEEAILGREMNSASLNDLRIPAYAGMPTEIQTGDSVRDRLQQASNIQQGIRQDLNNQNYDQWINRSQGQAVTDALEKSNKGKSTTGKVLNTIGEYLANPGAILQATAESLPYALGATGIAAGTLGMTSQNQSDAFAARGNGGLPTDQNIAETQQYNLADAGLNFAENVVNARAIAGLSNAVVPSVVRQAAERVAASKLGQASANVLSGNRVLNAAGTVASTVASRPVRELAATMGTNAITEALQNQIETRNLLGNDTWDTDGNINAGVIGALSAGVMAGPTVTAQAARTGFDKLNTMRVQAQENANPRATEQRQAAMDAQKPYVDLTNPEHADFNPQAAVRQQTAVFGDSKATPEAKQEAVERAQSVRDGAEQTLASVQQEVTQLQQDNAILPELNTRIDQLQGVLQAQPDHPQAAQIQQVLEGFVQRRDDIIARQPDETAQADLVDRYESAQANAERVRSAYDQFAQAANLKEQVAPETVQENINAATNESASQTQVDDAANHVVTHPMQYTPEQLSNLANDTSNRFTDDQRTAIRALADARVAQNAVKSELTVNQDIMSGGKGYRSLPEYTSDFADAVRTGNTAYATNLMDGMNRFADSHTQKAALARQVLDSGNPAQIIRQNGQWTINEGRRIPDSELRKAGGLNIHSKSGRLVSALENEVNAIQATQNAMQTMQAAARPVATADASQPPSQPQAEPVIPTVQAKPEQAGVEGEAKAKPIAQPNRRTSDDLKVRTQKQQAHKAPAETQSQITQDNHNADAESDVAVASTSDTDSNVVSDQTTAVKTDENTKAEGAVSILRPEGKSLEVARSEETAKPFTEQNLVLTGFVQRVREGFVNPLVTVPNFMSGIVAKATAADRFTELNRYLAQPMNKEQKAFMHMFVKFHDTVANDIDAAIKIKQGKTKTGTNIADYRYQDFVQYLVNAEGKLDDNTKAAMTASMYSWLAENGNKLIATKSDLASLFHVEDSEITTATYNALSEIGSSQRAVVQSLGQRAYQMLGFKVLKDVDPNRAGRMQQALGMYAMHTLMKRGYLEQTTMSAREYFNHMTNGMDSEIVATKAKEFSRDYLNGESLDKSRITFNFVRPTRTENAGRPIMTPVINRIVEGAKGTQGIMSKLFSFDSSQTFPMTAKPGKFLQNSVGDFNQQAPSEMVTRLTKAQQQPYRINESVNNAVNTIAAMDPASLHHIMGVRTALETPYMHERDRVGQEAKNADVLRALDNANESISALAKDDSGRLQAVYMPLSLWSNNRVGVASNMLNPQGNKVHRILVGMEAHETTIPTNTATYDSEGNLTDYGSFLLVVAQGMEEAPIKRPSGDGMPTVDKVTANTYLTGMQDYLNTTKVKNAVNSMINVIEGNTKAKDIESIKDIVAEFGMGPQSFSALHSLALHQQAVNQGKSEFTVAIGGESDGVTNGPILTNILYGTADYDLLARGGLYTAGAGVTNVPQYREKGGQDYYQLLGTAQNTFWNSMYPKTDKVTTQNEAYRRAIDYLSPGFGSRKKAKVLATPFNYGSGLDSLKRASARDAIDGIYSHISGIAEAYSRSKEEGDQYKASVEKAINIVLNQAPAMGLKKPAFEGLGKRESLLSYELPKLVESTIMTVEMNTRGDASEAAIKQVAAAYMETRDVNTAITNTAYEVNRVLTDRMTAKRINEAAKSGEVGSVKGISVEGLSTNMKATLDSELNKYAAVVPSATGSLSTNPLESGYVAAKAASSFQTNNPETEVYGSFADAANPKGTGLSKTKSSTFKDYRSGAQVKSKTAPGVATSAMIVQGTDAAISTRVIAEMPSQNFHDANLFGIKDIVKGAQSQNKAMWDSVVGYESQLANTEAMIRAYKGINEMADTAEFTASDWANVQAATKQLAYKMGYNDNAVNPAAILPIAIEDAYNREIKKLETLKGIEYVNQYGYEGGEYQVTNADRAQLDKKIASLQSRRDKASVEAKALGEAIATKAIAGNTKETKRAEAIATAQRRQAVEQAASDSQPASVAQPTQNALERFLLAQNNGKVSGKDLMDFTVRSLASGKTDGSALQTKMRTTYAEMAKVLSTVLPDNLEVNIISASHKPEGVKGADLNTNARAWFYSDKNSNQVNIRMDGNTAPGLEVVMHEMLHAATARALDAARRDPKSNPEVAKVLDRMNALHSQVKTLVESNNAYSDFAPAVRNVDEMISWGMTNAKFQNFLDSVQTPIEGRSRRTLGTLFRQFATNVLNAIYAFAGKRSTDKHITATEALVMDTAELLQASNTGSDTALNMPMVSGAKAAQAVAAYTHRQVFDSLASTTAGKQNSPAFIDNLGKTIDNVSDKLFSQVGGEHLTSDSQGYTPGQVWANALATGKAPYTSKALSSGFHLTDQEAFAIESIETAVAASLDSGFGSAVNREIRKSWEAARARIKPEDFHNGSWSNATPAQKQAAQTKWDHLFKLEATQAGANRYMSQFVAMTLGHEETSRMMGFTADTQTSNNSNDNTFETAARYASHAFNYVAGLLSRTNSGQLVNQKANILAQQLVDIDLRNRDKSVTKVEEAFTYASDLLEDAGRKVLDGVHATADTNAIRNAKSPIIRAAGSVTRLVAKRNLDKLTDTMRELRDMNNPNTADGSWASILSDVSSPDAVRSSFEAALRHTNLIEQRRRNLSEITRSNVMEMFQDSGKYLTKEDQTALTYTLMRTDAHSLLNTYSLDQVAKLVTDKRTRNAEIGKLEQTVMAQPNGNDMLIRAKALGYYMVTGKATIPSMAKNAQAIASGAGTHYVTTTVKDRSSVLAESIDSLASLYAMQYSNPDHLRRTAEVMKRELPNQDNGIKAMLNVHKVLTEDAASTLFTDNEISRIKGYIPEVTNPYRDVKVVDKADGAELEKMGYQFIGNVPVDKTVPGLTSKAMYATKDNGSQRYVSGATSLTSNHRKGSSAIQNTTNQSGNGPTLADARKAVYAKASQIAKMNAVDFNPANVTDTYMIPVFTTDGRIMDFQYEMNADNRDTLLDRNNDFAHLLGQYAGQTFDKEHSPEQNRQVLEALYEDHKANFAKSPERYVAIGPMAKDERSREIWAMLPNQTRFEAEQLWGAGNPMQVRADLVNMVFGFRKLTIGNAFDKVEQNQAEALVTSTLSAMFGDQAKVKAVQGERAIQEMMSFFKDIIVIRNVSTMMRNQMSNLTLLKAYGVPMGDIARNTKKAIQAGLSYRKNMALMLKYQQQQRAGLGDYDAHEQRILQLQDQLARNPLADFIEQGTMPSIVDDVDVSDNNYTYASGLQTKVSNVTDRIPASVRTAAKWAFVSKDTPLYKFLANATQFSDFSSKYVLYTHAMNRAENKLSKDKALQYASDAFVNYDIPSSARIQYMNDIGILMFTKYRFRVQRAMLTLMKERPGSALAQSALVARFTNAPTALEPNMITGMGNPFSSSIMQVPGALDQPYPIKLLSNLW